MAKQLKKITLLSNALDIKSLRLALAELDLNSATKEDIALINAEITKIIETLEVDDTSLDTLQEIVAFIKANKELLDTLTIDNIIGLRTALDSKADLVALTAVEGAVADLETAVTMLDSSLLALEGTVATLTETVASNKADADSKITAETTAREAAISSVETEVAANTTAIEGVVSDLADETTAREAAVTALDTKVDANKTELEGKIADETVARETAVTALEGTIAANKTELEGVVADETAAREVAIAGVETAIASETVARETAINKVVTGSEEVPTYEEGTHVAGDVVLDAEGNLCIVEEVEAPVRRFRLKK